MIAFAGPPVQGPYIPAPPVANYVQGYAPGLESDPMASASFDPTTNTVYMPGKVDKTTRGHEFGHAFDHQVLSDGDRQYFTKMMGLKGDWRQGTGLTASGLQSPNEYFADWYGNAANGHDAAHSWDAAYTSPPDPKVFRKFVKALERIAVRRNLTPYQ